LKIILGQKPDEHKVPVDLERLIETRLLLQANSGGGKSWALRRILEQTQGHVQQIVIDVEDEFSTLREKFDYVLAGSAGSDCPADVKSAALLARRLLELNVSAIINIFELKAHDRIRFVRLFLDSLINLPRELWRPVLIVIDEAHIFCPQHGEAESASGVIDLMTRGRKRGFCGILATQRISKLHKDAAAEANNKLIGRSALDVDMKRSADELGFTGREDQAKLRSLKPGEFFCFGPAISETIERIIVGDIQTTHPRIGQRNALPPPRAKVKSILDRLKDIPREAEAEIKNVVALQSRILELESQSRKMPIQAVNHAPTILVKDATLRGMNKAAEKVETLLERLQDAIDNFKEKWQVTSSLIWRSGHPNQRVTQPPSPPIRALPDNHRTNGNLPKMEKTILSVLAQYPATGRSAPQVAIQAGYALSGSFSNAVSNLRTAGFIEGGSDQLRITSAGLENNGGADPLPLGPGLLEYWRRQLPNMERMILETVSKNYPIGKEALAEACGYQMSGSFSNALSKLRTLGLVNGRGSEPIKISGELV
jgi:hypothetical protein